jgi:hypothetical protein
VTTAEVPVDEFSEIATKVLAVVITKVGGKMLLRPDELELPLALVVSRDEVGNLMIETKRKTE